MEEFIKHFGLIAVFAVSMAEGDAGFVVAGIVAHLGYFGLVPAATAGMLGILFADLVVYWLGRRGSGFVMRTAVWTRLSPVIERLAARMGTWQIVSSRFVYGTRYATMIFWGARRLSAWRFAAADALGCVIWGGLLSSAGYSASHLAWKILGEMKTVEHALLAVGLGVAAVVLVHRVVMAHRRKGAG